MSQKLHLMFTGLGAGNIGDEAMFTAFLKHYRLPAGSTVEVFDPSSPVIKTLPRQYRYVDWKDDLNNHQSVQSSRAALLVGGTPVAEEGGLDWPMRALAYRLRFCHAEGIPVHAVGVGVDSLYDEEARQIFMNAFSPITSWTVRTSDCRSALLDLGVPSEKIIVSADLAWLFSPDTADRQWAYDFWKSLGVDVSKLLLGVNVVNERWSGPTEVKAAIAEALDRIIQETGMQAAFLCNETREGDFFDACAAREVSGMMKEGAFLVPNEYFTPSQMAALLSFCTITLSQRYHFTILSILADTVPLSFARGQKMTALLKDLGEEPVGTMETCNAEYLEEQIQYVLSYRSDVGVRQQSAAKRLEERAKENFKFIDLMILNENPLPSLTIASELKSTKFDIRVCKNILVPRFDTFGDIVLLQGFIKSLLDFLPEARITLLVREGYDQLASLFPERLIWKTTRIHPYKKPSNIVEIKSLIRELKEDFYDLILTTAYNRTWLDDVIAATLTSSWRIVLGEAHDMPDYLKEIVPDLDIKFSYDLYDECISVEERIHETEKYQILWNKITGEEDLIPKPRLSVPDDEGEKAREFLANAGLAEGRFIFCFPAGVSNVSLKTWPEDNFAEVITHLEKKYSLKTLIAGHESEKGIVDKVMELARFRGALPEVWLGKDGDIPLACALIAKCYFYLGNDTGMMHMASALDKPVVAIFGGGTWPRFLPDNQIGFVLTQELPCTYCMWYPCFFSDAPCIKMVEVNDVINSIEKLLEGKVHSLEVHKGLPVNSVVNALLDKAIEAFTTIRRDRDKAVNEIHKRDDLLAESREVYHQAIKEIHKRDEEIHKRDEEIHKRDEEIHKRDAWLAESREVYAHALSFLPLVSIVTPVFNGAKWIENCIQSVQNQDYPKIEHIIVDGESTDGTLEICRKHPRLVIHSEKNRGQSHAINKGFAMAQGEILAWLCADDEYEPGAVSATVKGIMAGHEVVMGLSRFIDADGNVTADHPANAHDHYDHAMLLRFWKYTPLSQPATFWTRKMWETCGPLKENLFFAMDYDLWLRMSQRSSFKRIDHYVARYRIHSDKQFFSDTYGSRIERIKVGRQYWPSWWHPMHWILYLQYVLTRSPSTRHFSDAERLLNTTLQHLGEKRRFRAITSFILAHLKHVTTPLMPGYLTVLQRMQEEGIIPRWFWRLFARFLTRWESRRKRRFC